MAALGVPISRWPTYSAAPTSPNCPRAQMLADGQVVAVLAVVDQFADRLEDHPVVVAREVACGHQVGDVVPRLVVQHEPAEQRAFGIRRRYLRAEFAAPGVAGTRHGKAVMLACRNDRKTLSEWAEKTGS